MTTTMRRVELGVLIVLLVLAVFVVWRAASMPAGTVSLPGPGMIPAALGILLALTAMVLLVQHLRSAPAQQEPILLGNHQVAVAALSLIGAGLMFEPAGFVVTATLFLFVMVWMLSPLGWWRSLIAAAAASLLAKLLFSGVLNVSLPPFPWRS